MGNLWRVVFVAWTYICWLTLWPASRDCRRSFTLQLFTIRDRVATHTQPTVKTASRLQQWAMQRCHRTRPYQCHCHCTRLYCCHCHGTRLYHCCCCGSYVSCNLRRKNANVALATDFSTYYSHLCNCSRLPYFCQAHFLPTPARSRFFLPRCIL